MKTLTKSHRLALAITSTLLLGLGFQFVFAWTAPTDAPPNDNTEPPLTTGVWQSKKQGLILNNSGSPSAYGLIVANGGVGIGTLNPRTTLELNGSQIIENGNLKLRDNLTTKAGSFYVGISDEPTDYNEEFVMSFINPDGVTDGDDRSSIFIGPNSEVGGLGRVEIDARLLFIDQANVGIGTANPTAKLQVAGEVRAEKYCNSDGTKCLEFDPNLGDPLYVKTVVWNSSAGRTYTDYNTALINIINSKPITAATKSAHIDVCVPYDGQFFNTDYLSNPTQYQYCGNYACEMETGIWPTMVTISDMCSVGNGVDCNDNKFFVSWDCLNVK